MARDHCYQKQDTSPRKLVFSTMCDYHVVVTTANVFGSIAIEFVLLGFDQALNSDYFRLCIVGFHAGLNILTS